MRKMISPHISEKEVKCKCCGELVIIDATVKVFEWLRNALRILTGKDVKGKITSWYRCPAHDIKEGGSGNHPRGDCWDGYFYYVENEKQVRLTLDLVFSTLKNYPEAVKFAIGSYNNNRFHIGIDRISKRWDKRTKETK